MPKIMQVKNISTYLKERRFLMLNKKDEILKLYYEEHLKQQDIAQKVEVSQGYVSQVIKTDKRYNDNRETKHKASIIKKANYNKEYYKTISDLKKKIIYIKNYKHNLKKILLNYLITVAIICLIIILLNVIQVLIIEIVKVIYH